MKMRNVALAKCVFVMFSFLFYFISSNKNVFYGFSLVNYNSTEPNQIE